MPITPFHFGPGAAIHAIAPKRVSFLAFCSANVLIDIEPLYYMVTGQYPLHRFFHTYIGATIVMVVTTLIFFGALNLASKIKLPNLFQWQNLSSLSIWLGAGMGSYSHIVFDSVMHADIAPLSPFSNANSLYRFFSLGELHLFCILAAIFGVVVIAIRRLLKADKS
ncbi:hypothetical protein SAMN05192566_0880 [Methylophilus rhizosphaerae]|uniref:LexA-binding, inner membrane-associated hydrolase n=1 Tax=Methylophilus rhizosphaerae TaxID=492660 RepID=A0A1G9AY47_9PROT|nr:hypothetical protein [Methylophilus rhizosphaerae]SDK32182.1 hypothetical protein SAMN05192566_0880 [Methylophilus rhizosphaerae]